MPKNTHPDPEHAVPINDNGTSTLDPSTGYLVVINTYSVEPDRVEDLLNALVLATNEVLRHVPGFISANLHISSDGTHLVNYAQWESGDLLKAAGKRPDVAERIKRVGEIAKSFSPVQYELRICLPAAPESDLGLSNAP